MVSTCQSGERSSRTRLSSFAIVWVSVASSAQNLHVYCICYDQYDFAMLSLSWLHGRNLFTTVGMTHEIDRGRGSNGHKDSLYMHYATALVGVQGIKE